MKHQRLSFAGSSTCTAPASTVWAVWTNPSEWPGGVIDAATIDRNFGVGAKIRMKVQGGLPSTATVVQVEPPRIWVGVTKFPGLTMTFEHVIDAAEDGTTLTEQVNLTGPFAGVAGRLMGSRLADTFGETTARIAHLAEARPPS